MMKRSIRFLSTLVRTQQGFTLIELLASAVVIVTVGFVVVVIIVSALRGQNKTNNISTARQNGTYAISQVSKLLRFAQSVDAVDGDTDINCVTNTPLPEPQSVDEHTSITVTNIDGGVTTLSCAYINGSSGPMKITSNSASLIDTEAVQIPAGECEITCNQSTSSDALIVGIRFSLETARESGSVFSEFVAATDPLEFNNSVILRNVGR